MRHATLAILILAYALPTSAGVIRVTATYPGADARTVDEAVVGALFRQFSSVEDLSWIESEARNDGTLTLTVCFQPKTDLNLAEMRVQNRVNLALPTIPSPCRELGISVRKFPAGPPVFWLALTGDDDIDEAFLRNFANVGLKSEFARIPGVADVRVVGIEDFGVRVQVNPDRLAAYRLTAGDVIGALRRQNAPVAAGGTIGGPARQYTVTTSGRLKDLGQFEAVILRANQDGEVLRLRDVAKVKFGTTMGGFTRVDGKPAALIAVTAWPGKVSADQFRKTEGVGDLPPRLRFDVVADRSADRLVAVELALPPGTSLERIEKVVTQATDLIHGLPGKRVTSVAVAEGHEPNAATILVKVPAKGGPTAADVDKALNVLAGAKIRVGDVPAGCEAFPVRIALTDPGELSDPGKPREERFREAAGRVVMGLARDRLVAEPAAFPGPTAPQYAVEVDREKCAALGVEPNDVFTTLQVGLGGVYATDFHKFRQALRVTVQSDPQFARNIEDLTQWRVRSAAGEMVVLETVVKVRKVEGPSAVVRVNGYRATIITAAPAAGQTPADAAAKCVKLAEKVLPKGYHVKDLTGP